MFPVPDTFCARNFHLYSWFWSNIMGLPALPFQQEEDKRTLLPFENCVLLKVRKTRATQRKTRLNAVSGGRALARILCAGWWGGRRSDHHTLSLRAGAAPGRQLSRWSACSKLSPPKRSSQGPPPSSFFCSGGGVWQGRLSNSLCAKLEAFVLLFHSENTLIMTWECLFRELVGNDRWEMKS